MRKDGTLSMTSDKEKNGTHDDPGKCRTCGQEMTGRNQWHEPYCTKCLAESFTSVNPFDASASLTWEAYRELTATDPVAYGQTMDACEVCDEPLSVLVMPDSPSVTVVCSNNRCLRPHAFLALKRRWDDIAAVEALFARYLATHTNARPSEVKVSHLLTWAKLQEVAPNAGTPVTV